MTSGKNTVSSMIQCDKIDPTQFDVTINALLISLGAEQYVEIFKKKNIGQVTLLELTDEDLIKIGIDDSEIRRKIIEEAKNLPLYEQSLVPLSQKDSNLGPAEIVDIIEESSHHLSVIYISVLANTLALKKKKNISDCLLYKDKYASDIALSTLSEITTILNSMDIAIHTQLKGLIQKPDNKKNKKIIVGAIGSAIIATLTVLFVQSLKRLK